MATRMALDVRRPPIGAVISQHKQGVRGSCGWCGKAVEEKTEVRGYLKFWHAACQFEMDVITRPDSARRALLDRDKGICCDCGEDWSQMFRLVPEYRERDSDEPRVIWAENRDHSAYPTGGYYRTHYWDRDGGSPFVELRAISLWHADHKTPLWKAVHLPDLERLEYFKLANLVTRCHPCHERKTTEEAAERAKFNRIAAPPAPKQKPKFVSRKLGQRPPGAGNGFPPRGSTPMRRK